MVGSTWGSWSTRCQERALRRAVASVASLMVAVGVLVPMTSPAGAALASPTTAAFFDSEAGSFGGGGTPITFSSVTDDDTYTSPSSYGAGYVAFNLLNGKLGNASVNFWISFSSPTGTGPLLPGDYEGAQSGHSATNPGLDVSGNGLGCNTETGRFIVDDATYTSGGAVQTFSARFEFHCEGNDPALFGAVSYNSTADYRTVSVSSNSLNLATSRLTPTHADWTITNDGPSNLTPTGFTISGADASKFAVTNDSCAGTLTPGTSCGVAVTYTPTSVATANATLSFFDELAPEGSAGQSAGVGTGRDISLIGTDSDPLVSLSTNSLQFPPQRVGTYGDPMTVTMRNTGTAPLNISDIQATGANFLDFGGYTTCGSQLSPNASCDIAISSAPTRTGARASQLEITDDALGSPQQVSLSGTGTEGYYIAGRIGDTYAEGDAVPLGGPFMLSSPVVSISTTPDGDGDWLATSNGGVYNYGDAQSFGSASSHPLNQPVVGMASTPDGQGYWLVASDGGIFTFGDARFFGSTGAIRLNKPVVGMASTPDGRGYWLVASDGGIFTFGDAGFFGSTGAIRLNQPVVGLASSPDGEGYWLVASDGGIFTFGDAKFFGSTGAIRLNKPVVGMASTPDGRGYWLVASDGGIFTFGDAPYLGSIGDKAWSGIVGMAGTAPPLDPYRAANAASFDPNRDVQNIKLSS